MKIKNLRQVFASSLLILAANAAMATDTFNPATNQLTLDSVVLNGVVYGNVVVTINSFTVNSVGSSTPVNNTGGYPFNFKNLRVNSLTTGPYQQTNYCQATVSITNVGSAPTTSGLIFDLIIAGTTVGQIPFTIEALAPGATASLSSPIAGGTILPACGTFTLQFNAAASF
jgi:hypothetical protein